MSARPLRALVAVILAGLPSLAGPPASAAGTMQSGWSAPTSLGGCALAVGPRVAFPSESPSIATGPGAIVWAADPSCGAAASAGRPIDLSVAALGPGERATLTSTQHLSAWSGGQLAAVGASRGRIAVAARLRGTAPPPAVALLQGRAGRPLDAGTTLAGEGRPFSLARAYLGDAAVATVQPGVAIEVRVERYFRSAFDRPLGIPIPIGGVSALVATMDYRSDVLVAWEQNGAIYAHMLRASGRTEPTQRVGNSSPNPQLQALVSDNDHAMIAWSSDDGRPAPAARTSVHIAFSGAAVRFTGSRLVASFGDPRGAGHAPGSLALVRLSTENVMLAWTAAEHGHYVVRAVPAVFAGTRPAARLSDPGGQSVLADLAPGPAGEAVALWRSTPSQGAVPETTGSELWAARTFIQRHGRVGARTPEMVAAAAASAEPSIAVDPASDHAVAAWLEPGAHPRIEYATGPGATGYRPSASPGTVSSPGSGTPWLGIAIAAAGAAGIGALLMTLALRRRAATRRAGGAGTDTRRRRSARTRR